MCVLGRNEGGYGGAIKRWGEVSCAVACGKPPRKGTPEERGRGVTSHHQKFV
jgi:hypothetical protein